MFLKKIYYSVYSMYCSSNSEAHFFEMRITNHRLKPDTVQAFCIVDP